MELHVTIVTGILFISFLVSFTIAIYSKTKGFLRGQHYFTATMFFASFYSLGGMVESAAVNISDKILWSQIEYIGVVFAPVLLLAFVLRLIHPPEHRLNRLAWLLYIIPVITQALVFTNDLHFLIWDRYEWSTDGINILVYHHGIAYYFFAVWCLLVLLFSIYVIQKALADFPVIMQKQLRVLSVGCLIPIVFTALYLFDISPLKGLDLTIMSLPFTGLIFAYAISRFGMFKIIPSVSSQITSVMQDGLIVMDENGEIMFLNPAGAKIIGLKEDSYSIHAIKDVEWLRQISLQGAKGIKETEVLLQSDPEKWLEITINEIRNDYNLFKGNLILLHDITKRKRLEQQSQNLLNELHLSNAQIKEAINQKDRIISIIAHDLRTSFHQMINLTGLLNEMVEELTPDKLKEFLADLQKSSEDGYGILEELLAWARTKNDTLTLNENIKVLNPIEQIIKSLALSLQNKQLGVNIQGDKELIVKTDGNVLNLVLRNLLVNAIKFSNPGSSITVELHEGDEEDTISIIDTGIGIPEADIPRIFDTKMKYTRVGTAGESGSGFGLILCKEMIERNNGELDLKSTEGKGSTFTIHLNKKT